MLRNKRNKVEFKEVATGKIIEVNAVTAEEIQREQQRLLAEGKPPLYELHETPDVKGLDSMVRRIVREELDRRQIGERKLGPSGEMPSISTVTVEEATIEEQVLNAIANIHATPAEDPENDDRFTAKGNVKQKAIEEYLGYEIDKSVYMKAINT
ncbi:MAG: hypothetical protein KAH44_07100 [Oricola sp.]|jgi:hypothetical protein|nr:hypothetical protein [Oricola sp.]